MNWKPNPSDPEIFHITHLSNLPGIVTAGGLSSDWHGQQNGLKATGIGYSNIKQRRLVKPVGSHPGTTVGQFVPFYFCPRSVMLYTVNKGQTGHPPGVQNQIVHLVSRFSVATSLGRPWAFTSTNAAAGYTTQFYTSQSDLAQVHWTAMPIDIWTACKEERQAEFLVWEFFPWSAVRAVIVMDAQAQAGVMSATAGMPHVPRVDVRPDCYYP